MASRSPVAIKTKKARMLAMKEASFIQMTGIMSEYQLGEVMPPSYRQADVERARRMSQFNRDKKAMEICVAAGLKV